MTKQLLGSWGVAFEAVNVQGNEPAQAELERLGVPRVPATVLGEELVHGWNPEGLARLVGVEYTHVPLLNPRQLAECLDRILAFAQYFLGGAPDALMPEMGGGRKRTLRELGYHLFNIGYVFVDAVAELRYPMEWITDYGPEEIKTGPQLAEFGGRTRERLHTFFAEIRPDLLDKNVDTYYGEQSVLVLLERTAWHCGQHLRQIHDLLCEQGVVPREALDSTLFEGLPMPEEIW